MKTTAAIIFFDDECLLCNRFAQWIIRHDKEAYFRFAALQSPVARKLLAQHNMYSTIPDSVVLMAEENIYTGSEALLQILNRLPKYKKYAALIRLLPKFLRNVFYRIIAHNRYALFGKTNKCLVAGDRLLRNIEN